MLKTVMARATIASILAALAISAHAIADTQRLNIPAGSLLTALETLAKQANVDLVYQDSQVQGLRTGGVVGEFSPQDAVMKLLEGTPLKVRTDEESGAILITTQAAAQPATSNSVAAPTPRAASAVTDPPAMGERRLGLEEIIVTAQRRTERAVDVPQSMTVLSGDQLARVGVQGLQGIGAQVPGLTLASSGPGQDRVSMRGISMGADVGPTVGIYVDDVPYGSSTAYGGSAGLALQLGTFDVQRIEVLRGPQGTLYGANAFGGILKYVMVQPDLQAFRGRLQVQGSTTDGSNDVSYGVRGAASLPLLPEKLAIGVSAMHDDNAGWVRNVNADERVNGNRSSSGRLSALASVTEHLTVRATALLQQLERDGTSLVGYNVADGEPTYGELTQSRLLPDPFDQDFQLYALGGDYSFAFATLSANASYQSVRSDFSNDSSSLYVPLLSPVLGPLGFPLDAAINGGRYETGKSTLELRLSSEPGDIEWLIGLFYTDEDSDLASFLDGYADGALLPVDIGHFQSASTYEEVAVYADVTYKFNSKVDITAGARLGRNEQTYSQTGTGLLVGPPMAPASFDETVDTYLATLRYHLNDRNMIYARAASGYRPGGPNLTIVDPLSGEVRGNPRFDPDTLWNYEVGAKLRPADWASIEASAFHIDWSDIQLQLVVNGVLGYGNGGKATSEGFEFGVALDLTPAWRVRAAGTYTDATLSDPVPSLNARAGERLPNTPKWSGTISTDYQFALPGALSGRIGAAWRYVGERNASVGASASRARYDLPAFDVLDINLGVEARQWTASIFANNLLDERGQLSTETAFAVFSGSTGVALINPRCIGLSLTRSF
jgi:iron complex outermembrane receptor protein